jgi:hypothetical protein
MNRERGRKTKRIKLRILIYLWVIEINENTQTKY